MSLSAPNHRAVDHERERPRDHETPEQGQPEARVAEAGFHGARDYRTKPLSISSMIAIETVSAASAFGTIAANGSRARSNGSEVRL